ncbi:MAG: DUF2760 domain-containing protein [Fimbriiglobus sp.]
MSDSGMLLGLALGAGLAWFVVAALAVARAGGVGRVSWGLTVAGRGHQDLAFDAKVNELMGLPPAAAPPPVVAAAPQKPATPPKPTGEPLRLLTLLQEEARLVDFLLEDISAANDAQVGAAVRDIHRKAQATLKQHVTVEPVLAGAEGDRVTVPVGFDPSAVRVVGNVTGQPPFSGELQHPGWKVTELKLPPTAAGQDLFVVQPAEVHVG